MSSGSADTANVQRARGRVRRAASLAAASMLASARREVRAALAEAPRDPITLAAAGVVLFVTRDYHDSLLAFERAAGCGAGVRAHWHRYERAVRLGWDRDARAALEAGAADEPNEPRWRAALLALHTRRRDWDAALAHGAALRRLAPDVPSGLIELAGVHAARGDASEVESCVERALAVADAVPLRLEAARLLRIVGSFAAARRHLRAALTSARGAEGEVEARVALAELALWSRDHRAAEALAREALAHAPSAGAERTLGILAHLEGRRDEAAARLAEAVRQGPDDPEAHAWLAEIAIREGRYEDAHAAISRAIAAAGGALFPAHLLRLLVVDIPAEEPLPRHLTDHHRAPLRALCPELAGALESGDRGAFRALLERALERMHGNRSAVPTWLDGEVLRLVPGVRDPRAESRRVLERVRLSDPDALLAELDALVADFPWTGLPLAHKGELLLWLGRLDEARAALERAIDVVVGTRWAHIGLTAIDILSGAPERALETSARGVAVMSNTVGPAVHVHRGEALRRLGRLAEAEAELTVSAELNPTRLSAWLNLGLLRIAQGDAERAAAAAAEVFELAPGLLSDAAREAGVELFGDRGAAPDAASLGRVLARALEMLRGNRSSTCVTYFTAEGALRFGRHGARRVEPLHANDREALALAVSVLERGLSALPQPGVRRAQARASSGGGSPAAREAGPSGPTLTPEEIEHFLEHGYVLLRGCLPRAAVDAWVAGVRERAERDPRRWMRWGSAVDPSNAPDRLDFGDLARWPSDSVTVEGDRLMEVRELSPRLWGALCDLVGGEERLRTRRISDHVILRLPSGSSSLPLEQRYGAWHMDDPRESTRLDGILNGVLGLVLLSDVAPGGGATMIAPESVGHVARMLAERPEGVDFVERGIGERIVARCSRLVECTGSAGDVYLAHPFMIHCGSVNCGATLRWLANPNFALDAPLAPLARIQRDPASLSPVELAIARALDRSGGVA